VTDPKFTHSAAQQGRNPDERVQEMVARHFDEEARFVEAVKRARPPSIMAST